MIGLLCARAYQAVFEATRNAVASRAPLLEGLEGRTLFSGEVASVLEPSEQVAGIFAAVTVAAPTVGWVGSSTTITNGQVMTSRAGGTDMGPMGVGGGSVTRRYRITNTTGAAMTLAGAPAVQLSGTNPGDFSIVSMPATEIAAGGTAEFVVEFAPTAAGTRAATVTIPLSGDAYFSFRVAGTGLNTTTAANGLQIATTSAGEGAGAVNGDRLFIDYSGYLLDGTPFDSSLQTGRWPFELTLGNGGVIDGWTYGLVGMKMGEKRVLIIPPELAYGHAGQGDIPPDATLIFELERPWGNLGVSGKGVPIVSGSTTVSTTDGTNFGTRAVGSTPVTHTFVLSNVGRGPLSLTAPEPYIQLTGPNAADFAILLGENYTFSIRFTPRTAGLRTAIVTIPNTGHDTPNFSFVVQGMAGTNTAPTSLSLSRSSVAENKASGTHIGTLSAKDANSGDTRTFSLYGASSYDNEMFRIVGTSLRTAAAFNYESKRSYTIRVRVTDWGKLTYTKLLTINVTNVNEAPTSVSSSSRTVKENLAAGTIIGTLSARDPDAGTTFTYALVNSKNALLAADNVAFKLVKSGSYTRLATSAKFDYETRNRYAIVIRAYDQYGKYFDQAMNVYVSSVNESPGSLSLAPMTVQVSAAAGSLVGLFANGDPDAGGTHTYALISGTGDADNATFRVEGNQLLVGTEALTRAVGSTYSIRVRVTDQGGLYYQRPLVISVVA